MRPTRLLLVTNTYPTPDRPQVGPFVARRVAALRARGVEVVVAGPSSYRHSSPVRHLQIAWRALTARGPFDGVEAHPLYAAGVIGLVAARLRRRPLLAYAHGGDVADYAVRSRVHRALASWVARGAGVVVANSSDTAGYVQRLGAIARVVSPGVDLSVFRPAAESGDDRSIATRSLRDRLGPPEGPLAVFLGTLSERKGADVFAAGVDSAPGWQGVMIGDGPLAQSLAASHPSIRQVHAVPSEQVPDWLRAADVVVVPSRREPLGLAAVEALACGTPVIASNVGGLREVVRDDENGLLVPPSDAGALAAALVRLQDPRLRAQLGTAGPASVAGHDMRTAAAQMADVWAELGVRA
ncbi:MAG TPA: glycosyltransferase [Candidatus Limnocylindrales bacterium]